MYTQPSPIPHVAETALMALILPPVQSLYIRVWEKAIQSLLDEMINVL